MEGIPMDDVRQLWKESQGHSWSSLHQTLEQHKGKAGGMDNFVVQELLMATSKLEGSHTPFPNSADELQNVLNKQVQQMAR